LLSYLPSGDPGTSNGNPLIPGRTPVSDGGGTIPGGFFLGGGGGGTSPGGGGTSPGNTPIDGGGTLGGGGSGTTPDIPVVPLPLTGWLLASSMLALVGVRRRGYRRPATGLSPAIAERG